MAHLTTKNNFTTRSFLWRRFWRIVPLYWMALLLILFISLVSNAFDKEVATLGIMGVVKSFLIVPMQEYPLLSPGWSLEHEIIFYIIVALVVPYYGLRGLGLIILLLWLIGLNYDRWDYHLFSNEQIYFFFGIIAYWLRKKLPALLFLISFICLSNVYLSLYGIFQFPVVIKTISLAIGFAFLIATFVSLEYRGIVFPRIIVRIGDISYSLYLSHVFVYIVSEQIVWRLNINHEVACWIAILVAIFVATIVYKYIETPLHKIGHAAIPAVNNLGLQIKTRV